MANGKQSMMNGQMQDSDNLHQLLSCLDHLTSDLSVCSSDTWFITA